MRQSISLAILIAFHENTYQFGAFPQFSCSFNYLLDLTDESLLSFMTSVVKARQIRRCQGLNKLGATPLCLPFISVYQPITLTPRPI